MYTYCSNIELFRWGASPHDVASVGGAAPILTSGGEFRQYLAPALPPLEEFQTPARRKSSPRSHRLSVDDVRRECSVVDVARRCCSAVDVAWPCCSTVDVTRLCCSAVDVARRLRSAVDVALDPLALPSSPVLPPLVSLLLLTPPTCLALTLVPPTCLALVLASPHSPCFCFSLPPQVPRPASRSPHRPLYVPSSSSGPIAGPDFLGRAKEYYNFGGTTGIDVRWSDFLTGRAHQATSSLTSEPVELQVETVRTSGGNDLIEQCVHWWFSLIPAAAKSSQTVRSAFPSIKKKSVHSFINLVTAENLSEYVVRTRKEPVNIWKHTVMQIQCLVKVPHVQQDTVLLFESHVNPMYPDGLELFDTLLILEKGARPIITISMQNRTDHDITLSGRTELGTLQPVKSVLPISNTQCEATASVIQVLPETTEGDGNTDRWDPPVDVNHLTPPQQQQQVKQMLREECHAFSKSDDDIGCVPGLQLSILLNDNTPVVRTYTSVPKLLYQEMKDYLHDLIAQGWVAKPHSPYSSPTVCVHKKDGSLRLCIDYRDLNNKTIPDRQPIPRVQDILDGLGGNAWFSLLDQEKAYHQGFISPESRYLTAFTTPWGLYEWIRIPFGLMNAPAVFQWFMEESLEGLRDKICIPYLDDILVFTESFEEQVEAVKKVLQRIVSAEGSRIDPADTVAVTALKEQIPSTVGELRKILGLLSYYRQYIKDFSQIASPLYDLLKSNTEDAGPQRKRKHKIRNNKRNHVVPSSQSIEWTAKHQEILEKLINCLIQPPILGFPDFSQPFILHTDASNQGLGAVLYQQQNGKLRVIAYGSRTLTAAEKNYHLHSGKLEFLALKWAITEKFRDYLYYAPTFTVFSDNNPLTYVLTSAKLNATGCRWVSELADFHFTIRYRPGKENIDADSLSRMPADLETTMRECTEQFSPDCVGAVIQAVEFQGNPDVTLAVACQSVLASMEENEGLLKPLSKEEIRQAQKDDKDIR
ncbi:hypothetical protein QTP86_021764, partial [Hemibagrus guttatus]